MSTNVNNVSTSAAFPWACAEVSMQSDVLKCELQLLVLLIRMETVTYK